MALAGRLDGTDIDRDAALTVGTISGSHFVNHMFLVLLPPVFGVLASEFSVGLATLGTAVGVLGAFSTAFQLPFGFLSDNVSRVWTLVAGLLFCGAGAFVVAAAPTVYWLFAGQALIGVGIAAHHPAHFPLLSSATAERNRGRVFSLHGFAGNLGYAATPAVITAVLLLPGRTWRDALGVIGLGALLYAVLSGVVLGRLVDDSVTTPESADRDVNVELSSIRRRVAEEVRSVFTSRAILALALLALITAVANWGLRSYAVVLLTDGYGVSLNLANSTFTAMFAAAAAFVLLGGDLTDRISSVPILLASYSVLFVAAVLIASFVVPPTAAMALVVFAGGSLGFGLPARDKLTDLLSEQANLGRNFALITVGVTLSNTVAPPVFGLIIDHVGFGAAFYAIGAIAVVGGVLAVGLFHRYRDALESTRTTA